MAYIKTNWQDRIVEFPNRYVLQDNGDGTYTLIPQPGNVIQQGTTLSATNMNNIEDGIEAAHNLVEVDSRTPDDSQTAQASGTILQILNFFANMIKRITGETSWTSPPKTTLADLANYNFQMYDKDANGIYTRLEEYRDDGTLFRKTVLSNPDANGNYQTEMQTKYDTDGTTVIETRTFTLTYDTDGKLIQREVAS